jgi:ABC-type Fe3+-hydroxamate transport system substrate-binding protein
MQLSSTDQLHRPLHLPFPPKRIVSLVPSQTELLYALGLSKEVVGITKFCVHPASWFGTKQRVGGTKTVNIEKVEALQPDLVIANKEENVREQIEALEKIAPVWISDIETLEDAIDMIGSVGTLVGRSKEAEQIVSAIELGFQQIAVTATVPTAYLIWKDPLMAAGKDTFIQDMMQRLGFENVFGDVLRYPVVTTEQIMDKGCKLLLLSSEPFPFNEKHAQMLQPLLPGVKIELVDGEMFSWYGSRLTLATKYLRELAKRVGTLNQGTQMEWNRDNTD